jgi:hypothetical protein
MQSVVPLLLLYSPLAGGRGVWEDCCLHTPDGKTRQGEPGMSQMYVFKLQVYFVDCSSGENLGLLVSWIRVFLILFAA